MTNEQRGIENEGTGSLRVPEQKDRQGNVDPSTQHEMNEKQQGEPGRSGQKPQPETDRDRGEGGSREGYEDHGGSRDDDGTQGESSGSRPGYQ